MIVFIFLVESLVIYFDFVKLILNLYILTLFMSNF